MLDIQQTIRQCEQDASILHTIRERRCETVGEIRAINEVIENTLGLADALKSGHLIANDDIELTAENLEAAAKAVLIPHLPAKPADPLVGKLVKVINGACKGAGGIITRAHQNGTVDVDLGAGNSITNARPGKDIGIVINRKPDLAIS